jgi:hypothetical protein
MIPFSSHTILAQAADHLATVMEHTWTVTMVLTAVGVLVTVAFLATAAGPSLIGGALVTTTSTFFGGSWCTAHFIDVSSRRSTGCIPTRRCSKRP